MNVSAHMSGQISGQVPNQAGIQLPGVPQQNGNSFQIPMQNLTSQRNSYAMEPDIHKARKFMQERIYELLMQRQAPPHEVAQRKIFDIVKRLEEGLFKNAVSKEDYMNLETLESRLHGFIKPRNHTLQHSQFLNSSAPIGTMIPTPGMPHSGNTSLVVSSSVDTSMISASGASISSSTASNGSLLPTSTGAFASLHGGPFQSAEGSLSNGCQQSASNFSMNPSGGLMMPSVGGQRVTSQMIPTPGFSSSSSHNYINVDSTSNGGLFPSMDNSVASQQLPPKHVGSQHSRLLQNSGGQVAGGIRSAVQKRSYPFQSGSVNSSLGNNIQMVNVSGSSDSYLNATSFGGSPKSSQQPFEQQQRQSLMQSDGHGLGAVDSSASGTMYSSVTPGGSIMNNHNLNPGRSQSISRSNSLMGNQLNMQTGQSASHLRPQMVEHGDKLNFQPQGNQLQSGPKQYQQQLHQFQLPQQYVPYRQQKHPSQQHNVSVKIDEFGQSDLASDLGNHVKPEHGMERQNEGFQSHVSSRQLQGSDYPSQFQQKIAENHPRSTQYSSLSSAPQGLLSTPSQNSQQLLQQHQLATDTPSEYNCRPVQSDAFIQDQLHSESENRSSIPGNMSHEQHVLEESRRRMNGHDEAERNNLPSEASITGQNIATRSAAEAPSAGGASCRFVNANRQRQFRNQQRWLLFLFHARRCSAPEGKCQDPNCITVQKLWKHIYGCSASHCPYPRCQHTRILLHHHKHCRDSGCPVCIPVKNYLQSQLKASTQQASESVLPGSAGVSCRYVNSQESNVKEASKPSQAIAGTPEDVQPSSKRLKAELPPRPVVSETGSLFAPFSSTPASYVSQDVQAQAYEKIDTSLRIKSEFPEVKMEIPSSSAPIVTELKKGSIDGSLNQKPEGGSVALDDTGSSAKQEVIKAERDNGQAKQEDATQTSEHGAGTKSGKPKIKGVSLTELFTPEQIREHIRSLRLWVGQSKAKVEKIQAMEHSMSENSCQLCAVEKLTFEPPPIYCTPCGSRIKRNAMYYTVGTGDTRHYFCIPCYNEARGDAIVVDGTAMSKSRMEKKKNDEETEEWWVQCDKCEAWQHQICALFNGRRNDGGQAEYTCPNCYIEEIERGERKPLPQSAVLGAKDLPRTILSDHIEHRLFNRLKQERQERARRDRKSCDEVPGAEGIVIRVVSSVDKKLEVKPRFLEIFREENYPTEFPYKSKVILLFQKIEGVEVCLFGMYVQEFGSESLPPNQRRVYLSYLDSVKYFRPAEVRTVDNEALRTFVYHEILIGYLEYCKKRGFTSCYIWACPPLKGEDYILYCHPEIQKTPKSEKLRDWYLSMLKKAQKEGIVVGLTNLYDHFFLQTGECKAKVTAARLPYFDGDYWPGAAEDMIYQINQEEEGRKQNKKGTTKKTLTKRALKASGQSDFSGNASKDILLMHKLGETIAPMKEDFIMVHLQHACSHCCWLMVSGHRWLCRQCKSFQLCDRCYEAEEKRDERERHPINQKDKHSFYADPITDVSEDTKDKDEILESEFFDTRQAFLSLCQGNHYQYDTLRRAKHSSMMVLYHLHNPTAPAFVTTCNMCHLDIETGQGWRCETCPDFDVCNNCYQKEGGINHPHKLTNHPSIADRDAQNKEARQLRVLQLRKMLDLLVHASQCRSPHCQYPNCRKVKGLFRHGIQCRTRASGGCVLCKKMWYLLQLHARACKESECHVPRCRDLKEHLKRLQQQSDSRRRAAVMEMMRQRAAEVAGNAS